MYLKSCLVKRMVWYLRDACFKMVAVHDYNNIASTNCSDTEYLVFVPLTIRTGGYRYYRDHQRPFIKASQCCYVHHQCYDNWCALG